MSNISLVLFYIAMMAGIVASRIAPGLCGYSQGDAKAVGDIAAFLFGAMMVVMTIWVIGAEQRKPSEPHKKPAPKPRWRDPNPGERI